MIHLGYGAVAKITKRMKFIFFVWTKLVVTLKCALGNIFKAFMVSFMLLHILVLRRRIALEEKSFRKKKRGNTRTQKKKKFATAEND